MDIKNILSSYDTSNITIWVLWGHSALEVCAWAKKLWFNTICVAKKWRNLPYSKYYKTNSKSSTKPQRQKLDEQTKGCIDECIVVDKWWDLLNEDIQETLRQKNTIFIHNRYFWVYYNFEEIENNFKVPIYGSRQLLKLEERDVEKNQYWLLEKAGIRIPKIYEVPELKVSSWKLLTIWESKNTNFNWLTLTKVNNATRTYERENFVASCWEEWKEIAEEKINKWEITLEALQNSVIEEFILWAQINFNFFYSPLTWELELIGTDTRRQTNLDGWLRLPAKQQLKINPSINPFHIETWHIAVTCKESLLDKAFKAWEAFVKSCADYAQPLIGPFALQWAIETDGKKEELVVFDVSMRIPWSPGIWATPYTTYLYWRPVSMWERVAMEIRDAIDCKRLDEILT